MLPIRDNIRSERLPIVNYALVALNIFVFVFEISLDDRALEALIRTWGLVPARYPDLLAVVTGPSVLTSMFLHGGLGHLASNLLYLFIFGDNVEDWLGHGRYLLFYVACGLAAALGQYLMDPASAAPMVGASGAISGVLGAYLVLYPKARLVTVWWLFIFIRFIELPAVLYLGVWFLMQLTSGLAVTQSASGGGVAFWAHVGGFVAGVLTIRLFGVSRARSRR